MSDQGIAATINKGPANIAMDSVLNYQEDGEYVKRPAIRNALAASANSYIDLLLTVFNVPGKVVTYLSEHWYNQNLMAPNVWWKDKQPIEPIIRKSLLEAIDLAENLPIISYWMPIGTRNVDWHHVPLGTYRTDEYPFEVVMMKDELQLTRIIVTPPAPVAQNVKERFTEPTNIWVVKSAREVLPYGNTDIDEGIATTRLYGLPPYRQPSDYPA